jgi:nucleotide-binding universal stress UspA family protein
MASNPQHNQPPPTVITTAERADCAAAHGITPTSRMASSRVGELAPARACLAPGGRHTRDADGLRASSDNFVETIDDTAMAVTRKARPQAVVVGIDGSRAALDAVRWAVAEAVSRGAVLRLAKEPFIRSTGGCAEVFMPMARRVGVDFDVAFEAREMSAVLEIVRSGLGISILPSAGLPALPDGVVVRPLVPKTIRRLGVAVSASASAPARAFLEQIAALER